MANTAKLNRNRKRKAPIDLTPETCTPADKDDDCEIVSPPGSRSRTFITKLFGQFIDEYLDTCMQLSGNSQARLRLVKQILAAASAREESLESAGVSEKAVLKRLANALVKSNKAIAMAAYDEDENA